MLPSSRPRGSSSLRNDKRNLESMLEGLNSTRPVIVEAAIRHLSLELEAMADADYRLAVDALCSLFYVDTSDRPDLEPALDHVTDLLAGQGSRVVCILLGRMEESDIKSHLYLARILGRIGLYALQPLRDVLTGTEDAYSRSFALYALGKMTCPEVVQALPEVLAGLEPTDREIQDSAARTLGRMVQVVPRAGFSSEDRSRMFQALVNASHLEHAAVRAKSIRSLGKMAAAGLMTMPEKETLQNLLHAVMDQAGDEQRERAFIVQKEAKQALAVLEGARLLARGGT